VVKAFPSLPEGRLTDAFATDISSRERKYITPVEKGFPNSASASCNAFLTMKPNRSQDLRGSHYGNLELINLQSQCGLLVMTQSHASLITLLILQIINDYLRISEEVKKITNKPQNLCLNLKKV